MRVKGQWLFQFHIKDVHFTLKPLVLSSVAANNARFKHFALKQRRRVEASSQQIKGRSEYHPISLIVWSPTEHPKHSEFNHKITADSL